MVDKNCISTISGKRFDPSSPSQEDIALQDIAHALSMISRANGHFTEFYSVARHSINCAYEARERGYSDRICLLCLLHDAAEAYIGDMTRPLRICIPRFTEIERKYQKIIFEKFTSRNITDEEKKPVKSVDDSLLYHEFIKYNGEKLFPSAPEINISLENCIKPFEETKEEFLALYKRLSEKTVWKA